MLESPLVDIFNREQIRYSMVWEDPKLLLSAMSIQPNDNILSIGSAGCNSLALLSESPNKVVCLDMNPAQIQLIELKKQSIQNLSRDHFLDLFQYRTSDQSLDIYEYLRQSLKTETRQYWDHYQEDIKSGIIHIGRLESYFNKFRNQGLLPLFGNDFITNISGCNCIEEQRKLLSTKMDQLKGLIDQFFNKESFSKEGRDERQYKFVNKSKCIETILFQRSLEILNTKLISKNPYLYYIFNGVFKEVHLPHYLKEESYKKLQKNINNLVIIESDLEGFLANTNDKFTLFNLSNIFEYVSEDHFKELMNLILSKSYPASKICHWNLFVHRQLRNTDNQKYFYLGPLSQSLHNQDEIWFYESFNIYQTQ